MYFTHVTIMYASNIVLKHQIVLTYECWWCLCMWQTVCRLSLLRVSGLGNVREGSVRGGFLKEIWGELSGWEVSGSGFSLGVLDSPGGNYQGWTVRLRYSPGVTARWELSGGILPVIGYNIHNLCVKFTLNFIRSCGFMSNKKTLYFQGMYLTYSF